MNPNPPKQKKNTGNGLLSGNPFTCLLESNNGRQLTLGPNHQLPDCTTVHSKAHAFSRWFFMVYDIHVIHVIHVIHGVTTIHMYGITIHMTCMTCMVTRPTSDRYRRCRIGTGHLRSTRGAGSPRRSHCTVQSSWTPGASSTGAPLSGSRPLWRVPTHRKSPCIPCEVPLEQSCFWKQKKRAQPETLTHDYLGRTIVIMFETS